MINYDVIIIGGGAAGMMCAGTAIKNGKNVLILDKNPRPARKVMITGKGRCNVTNNCPPEEFLKNLLLCMIIHLFHQIITRVIG